MEEYKEIWKDIPGYEPYQVSNLGRVRNNKELKTNRDATKRGKPLRTRLNRNGYEELKIRKDGKQIHMLVHRLVALAWIENPENKPEVDHIDTIRTNNCVNNLKWVNRIENRNNPKTQTKHYNQMIKAREAQIKILEAEISELKKLRDQPCG